jgi:hypothetical protein
VSAVRTLGWHTDRLRLDKGTGEICNLGKAGGNLYKVIATHELVGKLLVGLQQFHATGGTYRQTLFSRHDSPEDRTRAVEVGNRNSMVVAMFGKAALLETTGGQGVPAAELLHRMVRFIDVYAPEPLSPSSQEELFATLRPAPTAKDYRGGDAETVFADFYRENSRMTAAETMRLAHEVEPHTPYVRLFMAMARHRSAHVYNVFKNANP